MSDPPDDNPFDRYGIDPRGDVEDITAALRERIEDASDEATRQALRAAWESLTMHPERRLRAALGAFPVPPPIAPPPPPPRLPNADVPLAPRHLALRPSVLAALDPAPPAPEGPTPLDSDPLLDSP